MKNNNLKKWLIYGSLSLGILGLGAYGGYWSTCNAYFGIEPCFSDTYENCELPPPANLEVTFNSEKAVLTWVAPQANVASYLIDIYDITTDAYESIAMSLRSKTEGLSLKLDEFGFEENHEYRFVVRSICKDRVLSENVVASDACFKSFIVIEETIMKNCSETHYARIGGRSLPQNDNTGYVMPHVSGTYRVIVSCGRDSSHFFVELNNESSGESWRPMFHSDQFSPPGFSSTRNIITHSSMGYYITREGCQTKLMIGATTNGCSISIDKVSCILPSAGS